MNATSKWIFCLSWFDNISEKTHQTQRSSSWAQQWIQITLLATLRKKSTIKFQYCAWMLTDHTRLQRTSSTVWMSAKRSSSLKILGFQMSWCTWLLISVNHISIFHLVHFSYLIYFSVKSRQSEPQVVDSCVLAGLLRNRGLWASFDDKIRCASMPRHHHSSFGDYNGRSEDGICLRQ